MNVGGNLIDLDELVLYCKSHEARKYIAEAVACYKVGAYRACIITTWIAVVYDFVDKLRQLQMMNDGSASDKLSKLKSASDKKSYSEFEKNILEWAKNDFEFISSIEYDDLLRLLEDRHRCAHPSMLTDEDIYEPPAELARLHLRNAITHLLQHPPVQGKNALKILYEIIGSNNFPTDVDKAIISLKYSPIANPKYILVRDYIKSTISNLLNNECDESTWNRLTCSIQAIRRMHIKAVEKVFEENLSQIIKKVQDSNLYRVIRFLGLVQDIWHFLDASIQIRLEQYIDALHLDEKQNVLVWGYTLAISQLYEKAIRKLSGLEYYDLFLLVDIAPHQVIVPLAIQYYVNSEDFNMANNLASSVIIPLISFMTVEDIETIIMLGYDNYEVFASFKFRDVLSQFVAKGKITQLNLEEILKKYNINEDENPQISSKQIGDDIGNIPF